MNILLTLEGGWSRVTTQAVVAYIGDDRDRFAELMRAFRNGDDSLQRAAAGPISIVAKNNPELAVPYLNELVRYLPRTDVHACVRRNVVRLLQFVDVPKRLRGRVFSICLELIDNPAEPIAVRCFAMTAAARIADGEPDLLNELKLVAAKQVDHATAGMKVRIRRLLTGR